VKLPLTVDFDLEL
jgi:hypothetical protein